MSFYTWLPYVLDHLISCLLLSENNAYTLAFLAFFFFSSAGTEYINRIFIVSQQMLSNLYKSDLYDIWFIWEKILCMKNEL